MTARRLLAGAAIGTLLMVGCAPALDWREVRPEGGVALGALFPCKPVSHARMLLLEGRSTRLTLNACSSGGATWAVAVADVEDPARVGPALVALRDAAQGNVSAVGARIEAPPVPGSTPNDASGRYAVSGRFPDGRPATMQVSVFARGTWVIQATVLGERLDREALDTFFAALRLTS